MDARAQLVDASLHNLKSGIPLLSCWMPDLHHLNSCGETDWFKVAGSLAALLALLYHPTYSCYHTFQFIIAFDFM